MGHENTTVEVYERDAWLWYLDWQQAIRDNDTENIRRYQKNYEDMLQAAQDARRKAAERKSLVEVFESQAKKEGKDYLEVAKCLFE